MNELYFPSVVIFLCMGLALAAGVHLSHPPCSIRYDGATAYLTKKDCKVLSEKLQRECECQ